MSNENFNINHTRKTIEAKKKFKARDNEIEKLTNLIKKINIYYDEVIEKKLKNVNSKNRTWFDNIFNRIEFEKNGIRFYIEFTIIQSDIGGNSLKGSIIYGASRPECFSGCVNNKTSHKKKAFITRCDLLEDKPLIQFLIDEYGLITTERESEKNEWWINTDIEYKKDLKSEKEIKENKDSNIENDKKNLAELHFLTLNKIWKDALDWVNEKILP